MMLVAITKSVVMVAAAMMMVKMVLAMTLLRIGESQCLRNNRDNESLR